MSAKKILHIMASLCCTVSASIALAEPNASLTLISEDGIHMTTRLQYSDGTSEWVRFRSKYGTPIGPGEIDLRDRSSRIRVYVSLPCDSDQLRKAREEVVKDFERSNYRNHLAN